MRCATRFLLFLLLAAFPLPGFLAARAAPPKRGMDVVLVSVEVTRSKANGAAWDAANGLPDLQVTLRHKANGESYTTPVQDNTFTATFERNTIEVVEGDTIEITVVDKDAASNDLIGTVTHRITAANVRERKLDLPFGQVKSLKLELRP
jgi:hypothetical protein